MAVYNFKKELKLYIVYGSTKYKLDIYPDVNFSQTFNESSVPVKTLHTQTNMFEKAVIIKANPANFNFTTAITATSDFDLILDLLLNYDPTSTDATLKTADYYVEMNSEVFKLEKGVIESTIFRFSRDEIITITCSGTASKLSKFVGTIPNSLTTITGKTYTSPNAFELTLGGVVKTNIQSVSVELKSNVEWVENDTLHNSLTVSGASDSIYPGAFVVSGRTLSGNIQQYITDETNTTPNTWKNGDSLLIKLGKTNTPWLFNVAIPAAVYTNRSELQDLLMQSYDYRMISSPTNMSTVIYR